jgi:hypothetical protein
LRYLLALTVVLLAAAALAVGAVLNAYLVQVAPSPSEHLQGIFVTLITAAFAGAFGLVGAALGARIAAVESAAARAEAREQRFHDRVLTLAAAYLDGVREYRRAADQRFRYAGRQPTSDPVLSDETRASRQQLNLVARLPGTRSALDDLEGALMGISMQIGAWAGTDGMNLDVPTKEWKDEYVRVARIVEKAVRWFEDAVRAEVGLPPMSVNPPASTWDDRVLTAPQP